MIAFQGDNYDDVSIGHFVDDILGGNGEFVNVKGDLKFKEEEKK
eukprot:CAMPEP_0170543880 /NCGR_PEP_ID=MMETSP0211-20121228/2851_1 /TAXON_ID=311385 /ORGANISM="Pseudokeronopsis sp., Strain OXSARD2" /LENGTH=43 /DNA_ID= /DNA_START= /DNA_END= /DNA_ORIENTATION=